MRISRIYTAQSLSLASVVELNEAASHYLINVLRVKLGQPVILFNGLGQEYVGEVVYVGKRQIKIQLNECHAPALESPLNTHLAIGISKGDRMDWVLQKATELGVTQITPLWTARTEVKLKGERLDKKMQHWQQVIISACEQCQRSVLPQLHAAQDLSEFLETASANLKLVLHHRSTQRINSFDRPESVLLLVGPEGGLADDEIHLALQNHQFKALTLGPRVLRTETAPLAALTSVQLLWGDLA
jgi:16S rRNA (uracil1498-N3)-methyltransferase